MSNHLRKELQVGTSPSSSEEKDKGFCCLFWLIDQILLWFCLEERRSCKARDRWTILKMNVKVVKVIMKLHYILIKMLYCLIMLVK